MSRRLPSAVTRATHERLPDGLTTSVSPPPSACLPGSARPMSAALSLPGCATCEPLGFPTVPLKYGEQDAVVGTNRFQVIDDAIC